MRLCKYTKLDYLLDALRAGGVFASELCKLNDPYEWMDMNQSDARVCCLTKSRNAKKMWSHYADGHRGCVITVELPSEPETIPEFQKVSYVSIREFSSIDDPVKRLHYKDKKWHDEKEYRAVYSKGQVDPNHWVIINCGDTEKVFFRCRILRISFGCAVDENSQEFIQAVRWIKDYNDQQRYKKNKIEVDKYLAKEDRFEFSVDRNFNFERLALKLEVSNNSNRITG